MCIKQLNIPLKLIATYLEFSIFLTRCTLNYSFLWRFLSKQSQKYCFYCINLLHHTASYSKSEIQLLPKLNGLLHLYSISVPQWNVCPSHAMVSCECSSSKAFVAHLFFPNTHHLYVTIGTHLTINSESKTLLQKNGSFSPSPASFCLAWFFSPQLCILNVLRSA